MGISSSRREISAAVRPLYFTLFLCLVGIATASFAQDNWLGGTGNWSTGTKWSAGVPGPTSNVFIDHGHAGASVVTVDLNPGQAANATIDSDDSLIVGNGSTLHLGGSSVSNAGTLGITAFSGYLFFDALTATINNTGTISLNAVSGGTVGLNVSGTATLKGAGAVSMTNVAGNFIMGPFQPGPGASLTNQSTIQGSGGIGGISGIGSGNTFNNQGTINANQATPLIISASTGQTVTNSGTLEATNGATLELAGGTITNTGGTIHADPGSTVLLQGGPTNGTTVTGGTFTTSGTGVIADNCCFNTTTLNGVTIGTGSLFQLNTNHNELWQGTITNNGTFQINDQNFTTALNMNGAVTLKGTGMLIMSNDGGNEIMGFGQPSPGASLTNQITIQGSGQIGLNTGGIGTGNTFTNQGTINANQSTPLIVTNSTNQTFVNTGMMEATNGGTLELTGGAITNTGGAIHADAGSTVLLQGGPTNGTTITGGTLSSTTTGKFADDCCFNTTTLNGVTIAAGTTYQLNTNHGDVWEGTITNNGTFQINDQNNFGTDLNVSGNVTVTGSGKILMSNDTQNRIMGYGQSSPGNSLTNQITIQGAGQIGLPGGIGSGNTFVNDTKGTIYANQKDGFNIYTASGTFTNNGTLKVKSGTSLYVAGGGFTNGSGLVAGKYMVSGTLIVDGALIPTVSSAITLTGAAAKIVNQANANALTAVGGIATKSSLSLQAGQQLTTTLTSSFMNAGTLTVGHSSVFKVACNPADSCPYTQTGGTTTVDGTLDDAQGVNIQAGNLFGTGTIAASVNSKGSVTAGDSLAKAGKLSPGAYTQQSTGSLNIQIGGTTVGTQYSQLAVANGASLNGILNVKLINKFVPAIGDVYTILTCSARTGTFLTVHLPTLIGAHFQINYSSTSVTLTVVSG